MAPFRRPAVALLHSCHRNRHFILICHHLEALFRHPVLLPLNPFLHRQFLPLFIQRPLLLPLSPLFRRQFLPLFMPRPSLLPLSPFLRRPRFMQRPLLLPRLLLHPFRCLRFMFRRPQHPQLTLHSYLQSLLQHLPFPRNPPLRHLWLRLFRRR